MRACQGGLTVANLVEYLLLAGYRVANYSTPRDKMDFVSFCQLPDGKTLTVKPSPKLGKYLSLCKEGKFLSYAAFLGDDLTASSKVAVEKSGEFLEVVITHEDNKSKTSVLMPSLLIPMRWHKIRRSLEKSQPNSPCGEFVQEHIDDLMKLHINSAAIARGRNNTSSVLADYKRYLAKTVFTDRKFWSKVATHYVWEKFQQTKPPRPRTKMEVIRDNKLLVSTKLYKQTQEEKAKEKKRWQPLFENPEQLALDDSVFLPVADALIKKQCPEQLTAGELNAIDLQLDDSLEIFLKSMSTEDEYHWPRLLKFVHDLSSTADGEEVQKICSDEPYADIYSGLIVSASHDIRELVKLYMLAESNKGS